MSMGTDRDIRDLEDLKAGDSPFRSLGSFTSLIILTTSLLANAQSYTMMQSSFTGGELSPLAAARIDSQRYYASATTVENMIVTGQGPLVRRPGTRFAAATDHNNVARLIPFRYSADDVYALELTDSLMRVFRGHGLVVNDDNSVYELATPFDGDELDAIQLWQSADVCYLVDGNDWPQKLVRTDHNDWSIAAADINDGPFGAENITGTTLAADAVSGDDVNLVASAPIFEAGHVGGVWRLRNLVGNEATNGWLVAADTNSIELSVQADQNFQWTVTGNLTGTIEMQISYDGGATWTAFAVASGTGSIAAPETVYSNDSGQDGLIRVRCVDYTSGGVYFTLWRHAYLHVGVVRITAVTDPCNAVCDVVRTLASTAATMRWSEGAWSTRRGFPRAIASYNDRLVFAGTVSEPLRIWFSATGDYESFDEGAGGDADSFAYTLGRSEQDPIVWIQSQRRGLLAGTTGGVLEIQPMDSARGILPANPPTVVNTLAVPCSSVAPVLADESTLVLQRGGRKVREVLYSYDADALVAPDLTLYAEHVTAGGVTALAWTSQPYTALWGVRSDGQLLGLTYDRNYQVAGWHRHTLGGSGVVESVCTIPADGEDELWLVVRRTVDANTVRYVEYLAGWDWGDDQNDVYFVDCGVTYDGNEATTFSGLSHVEGLTVAVCADGAPVGSETVAAGAITLDHAASVVHAGLPFTSTIETVRYDIQGQSGPTWTRQKAVAKATLSVYRSLGTTVGPDAAGLKAIQFGRPGAVARAGSPALFTGDVEQRLPTSFSTGAASVLVVQSVPLPLTVRAIVAQIEVR